MFFFWSPVRNVEINENGKNEVECSVSVWSLNQSQNPQCPKRLDSAQHTSPRSKSLNQSFFFSRQDSNIFPTSINRTERGQMFWACPLTTTIKSAMHERLEPAQHVSSCSGSQNYPFYFNKPQRYSQSQPTRLHGRIVCLSVCYLKKLQRTIYEAKSGAGSENKDR